MCQVLCHPLRFGEDCGTFTQPRGRYAIEMYDTFLRLQGKTYTYKISYKNISRLFLLPCVALRGVARAARAARVRKFLQVLRSTWSTEYNVRSRAAALQRVHAAHTDHSRERETSQRGPHHTALTRRAHVPCSYDAPLSTSRRGERASK